MVLWFAVIFHLPWVITWDRDSRWEGAGALFQGALRENERTTTEPTSESFSWAIMNSWKLPSIIYASPHLFVFLDESPLDPRNPREYMLLTLNKLRKGTPQWSLVPTAPIHKRLTLKSSYIPVSFIWYWLRFESLPEKMTQDMERQRD